MPLKLIPPDGKRSPYFKVRGAHLGVSIDRSTKTGVRAVAVKLMAAWRDEIERGAYAKKTDPTFASAAIDYMRAGGENRFLTKLLTHFQETPLKHIDQKALNDAAVALYPDATPATRNRQVYSPAIAILRHAGIKQEFERPKGARGKKRTVFLSQDQARRLIRAAGEIDREFGVFLLFLLYTGCRLSEGCNLLRVDVHLDEGWAYVRETKNGDPRIVYLPAALLEALVAHMRTDRTTVFRFRKNGRLYKLLNKAAELAGVQIPERVAFHIFRHTYGAWMQRVGADLVGTGAWKSEQAARVYKHVEVTEEARKADLLPVMDEKPTRAESVHFAKNRREPNEIK